MTLILPRRGFLAGLASLLAAPAIVRAASLELVPGTRFTLEGDALVERIAATSTLDYTYWVVMGGLVRKMTGRDILAAPSGAIMPWLPQFMSEEAACEHRDFAGVLECANVLSRFRPTDERQTGLMFGKKPDGTLLVRDLAKTFDTDPVITRLRQEQEELVAQLARQDRAQRKRLGLLPAGAMDE